MNTQDIINRANELQKLAECVDSLTQDVSHEGLQDIMMPVFCEVLPYFEHLLPRQENVDDLKVVQSFRKLEKNYVSIAAAVIAGAFVKEFNETAFIDKRLAHARDFIANEGARILGSDCSDVKTANALTYVSRGCAGDELTFSCFPAQFKFAVLAEYYEEIGAKNLAAAVRYEAPAVS